MFLIARINSSNFPPFFQIYVNKLSFSSHSLILCHKLSYYALILLIHSILILISLNAQCYSLLYTLILSFYTHLFTPLYTLLYTRFYAFLLSLKYSCKKPYTDGKDYWFYHYVFKKTPYVIMMQMQKSKILR